MSNSYSSRQLHEHLRQLTVVKPGRAPLPAFAPTYPHEPGILTGFLHGHCRAVGHVAQAVVSCVIVVLPYLILPVVVWDLGVLLQSTQPNHQHPVPFPTPSLIPSSYSKQVARQHFKLKTTLTRLAKSLSERVRSTQDDPPLPHSLFSAVTPLASQISRGSAYTYSGIPDAGSTGILQI